MQPSSQNFEVTYRSYSDEDLAVLYAERTDLSDLAQVALTREIGRRGITEQSLAHLVASRRKTALKFDRRERKRRIWDLRVVLLRGIPGWAIAGLVVLLLLLGLGALFGH